MIKIISILLISFIALHASNNINLEAAQLNASNNLVATALNDVNILAKQYKVGELYYPNMSRQLFIKSNSC